MSTNLPKWQLKNPREIEGNPAIAVQRTQKKGEK
jgi:hypothetical protein